MERSVFFCYCYLVGLSLQPAVSGVSFHVSFIFTATALLCIPALQMWHPVARLTLAGQQMKDGSGKNGEIQIKSVV